MVSLLNNGKYKEATEMFANETDWDDQAVNMFVTGFDLCKCELLEPIKERLCHWDTDDFRTAMRLAYIEQQLCGSEKDEPCSENY